MTPRSLLIVVLALAAGVQVHTWAQQTSNTADTELAETVQILTGGKSRNWVFTQIDKTMGSADECTQGDVYHFAVDYTAVEERCENGHLKRDQHHWTLNRRGPLDFVLTIDGESYLLLFKRESNGWLMKLRTPSSSKTQPTVDKDFYYKSE